MPWKETCVYEERLEFVRQCHERKWQMTELCTAYGISRDKGYKWLERFKEEGKQGLLDRSRAPKTHPNAINEGIAQQLLDLRRKYPTWGPKKLRARLGVLEPEASLPASSTIGDLLKRHGLVKPRRRRERSTVPLTPKELTEAVAPNDVWPADFKGWFRTLDGQRCDPLTVSDAATRWQFCTEIVRPDGEHVRPVFDRLFREYGLPSVIRTDNGPPFASLAIGGLSRLSIWWIKLGIRPERIRPGHPEQNGRHERFHRTLREDTLREPCPHPEAQQRCFDRYRRTYNEERPHEALGLRTPAEFYRPSPRQMPSKLAEIEYPAHYEIRRVRACGRIKFRGNQMFLGQVLRGETVAMEQVSERLWRLYFGPVLLAFIDTRIGQVLAMRHPAIEEDDE